MENFHAYFSKKGCTNCVKLAPILRIVSMLINGKIEVNITARKDQKKTGKMTNYDALQLTEE